VEEGGGEGEEVEGEEEEVEEVEGEEVEVEEVEVEGVEVEVSTKRTERVYRPSRPSYAIQRR